MCDKPRLFKVPMASVSDAALVTNYFLSGELKYWQGVWFVTSLADQKAEGYAIGKE
jgi:hypothetical protein